MKRLNGFLESNREELENNSWLSLGHLPKRLNISGNLTKDTSHHILRMLLSENISQVNLESPKEREKDLNIGTDKKAVSEDDDQWQMEKAQRPSLNSTKSHEKDNSKRKY